MKQRKTSIIQDVTILNYRYFFIYLSFRFLLLQRSVFDPNVIKKEAISSFNLHIQFCPLNSIHIEFQPFFDPLLADT